MYVIKQACKRVFAKYYVTLAHNTYNNHQH